MIVPKLAGHNDRSIETSMNIYKQFINLENERVYTFSFMDLKQAFNNDITLNDFLRGLELFKNDDTKYDSFILSIPFNNKFASFYRQVKDSHFEWEINHDVGIITTRGIDTKILLHFMLNEIKNNSQELFYNDWYEKILSVKMRDNSGEKKVTRIKILLKEIKLKA